MKNSIDTSTISNLKYSLKRIYEHIIHIKPGQLEEENLNELARKAEALRFDEPLETYTSKEILNYYCDLILLIASLEQALNIEILDEEAELVNTLDDLIILLNKKIFFDEIIIHQKYFDELIKIDKIKALIVGRDPYPTDSMGIPFCKNDLKELKKYNCSGKHLLNGLGIDIEIEERCPQQIFLDLLKNEKIGFVNASYFFIGKNKPNPYQVKYSNLINNQIYKKSEHIIMMKSAEKLLKFKDIKFSDYEPLENLEIQMPIKSNWITVCHPDIRNSFNKYVKSEYEKLWGKLGGFSEHINLLEKS